MRNFYLLILYLICACSVFAQPPENSWINYSQQYFKIKIAQEGIYRFSQGDLLFSGIPISILDHRRLQVFHNGDEQYIYVYDQNQNDTINSGDYIEFYATRNDGSFDTRMYREPEWQPNRNISLYNDTAVYFLTWNNDINNRRITEVSDTLFSNYTPASYFIKNSYEDVTNTYIVGAYNSYGGSDIGFIESEGWMSGRFNFATKTVNTQNLFTGGPDVEINTSISGSNSHDHIFRFTGPGINFTDAFPGFPMRHYSFSIPASQLPTPTADFVYRDSGALATIALANISVKYPHTYNLENASSFRLIVPDAASQSKTRMDITNFSFTITPVIYDLTNHRRIRVVPNGSMLQALVDNDGSSVPKVCFLGTPQGSPGLRGINYVSNLPAQFNNFMNMQKDSAYIIITHKSLWNQAGLYKQYRDQTTLNKTIMVDIDELYDQFAYGIGKHPLSIKNFIKFILTNWTTATPEHMLLIGKSIHLTDFRFSPGNYAGCLVPAFGHPASDVPFTSEIFANDYTPAVPTGRIPAFNGNQVIDYLNKVQEYEMAQSGPPKPWMKEILHFVGGNASGQQQILFDYMEKYRRFVEDTLLGGHVTTYSKNSSAPIIINQSDSLQAKIDSGVVIMTFFGHASGAGFDVSTDVPSNYNNRGRYPVIVANSCFAGDIHTGSQSVSEQFVMEPYKGSIAFIASVGLGESYFLDKYSTEFFQNVSWRMYGQSLGKMMRHTISLIQDTNSLGTKTVSYEMSLDGDPALKIYNFNLPDLVESEPNISFTPSNITSETDTFSINIITRNIGRAETDSFNLVITRTFPDGTDSVFTYPRMHCYYADTISVKMRNVGFNSSGLNHFKVEADLDTNRVPEIDDYSNNYASTDLLILSSDIVPVYPYKYSIVPYSNVTFKASTSNPFAGITNYKFELDTSDFTMPGYTQSALYRYTNISASGGVITWSNSIQLLDSTVYFWRVANDSINNPDTAVSKKYKWNESSFMYKQGTTGWSQAHFHQFKEDGYENVTYNSTDRSFDFINNNKSLIALNYGTQGPTGQQLAETGYYLNNAVTEYGGCGFNSAVMIAVIDSITLLPWTTGDYPNSGCYNFFNGSFGNCRSRPEGFFIFRFDNSCPACLDSLNSFLDQVPCNNYILAYSWFPTNYSAYPMFATALNNIGFTNASVIPDYYPFMFFMQKCNPGILNQLVGSHSEDTMRLNTLLSSVWDRGSATSVLIGPSTNWTSLHWRQHQVESGINKDSVALNIFGVEQNGSLDTLLLGLTPASGDTSLNWISSVQYPYLKLQAYLKDDSLRTPPQLDKWQIYYDDVPEAALNANRLYNFHDQPLAEGDTLRMQIAIDNISTLPMDSLRVDFYLYDNNRIRHNLKSTKLDSLRVSQYLVADVALDTTFGLSGQNSLWIEANPFSADHQLERYHFNNLAEVRFNIERDIMNPILDVTFDGIHILNGDIVSGKPNILIQLHDENKFLALNDTSKFKVYLKTPGSNIFERVFFNAISFGATMKFTPAILPKNSCRIDYDPTLLSDGTYELKVEAADISNNESGLYNYHISFEVINKSTITEVLNYPNPFSTSTRFVFTLTGNQIPTYMKIQVVTVSGKVVREITREELGNIHIGRNITEYAWDGKDEYGDQLANGLYLYRVITNLHGEAVEKRSTEADKYFKKGWGKMYLMR